MNAVTLEVTAVAAVVTASVGAVAGVAALEQSTWLLCAESRP